MKPLLDIQGVSKAFGGLQALRDVTFQVGPGEIVGLIGPNGSGKTTLFNVISGFLRPEQGAIRLGELELTRLAPHDVARAGVGRTFQIVRPFQGLTVLDNVAAAVLFGTGQGDVAAARRRAEELLAFVGLAQHRHSPAGQLTLSQKKRLEVAKALGTEPRLLLLDEVFAGLNPREIDDAIALIFRLRDELSLTVLMVEHVMKAVMQTCQRIVVLSYGQKIAEGTPQAIATDPQVLQVYLGVETGAGH
ncbi:MAG: ABC transporter ATP-binding protein [Limnochordales bacterium]|nr:ABC transporter ATP-binding protein [Limnochordales bacterium]